MQRRSTARSTPRKKYTVDAFEGVPELADIVGGDDEDDAVDDEPEDEVEDEDDEEPEDDDDLEEDAPVADESDQNEDLDAVHEASEDAPLDLNGSGSKAKVRRPRTERNTPYIDAAKRLWARDLTLPSRVKDSEGLGGFHHSFATNQNIREQRTQDGWKWYSEAGGKEAFETQQKTQTLTAEEGARYFGDAEALDFVMGPLDGQKLLHLEPRQSLTLDSIWRDAILNDMEPRGGSQPQKRSGFMVNLGAHVQNLEWIPNNHYDYQYLSVAVAREPENDLSAHSPSMPRDDNAKCAIQIWRFKVKPEGLIDDTVLPRLVLVLCLPFTAVHTAQWCDVPCPEPSGSLGLLAIVPADGVLRVVDVVSKHNETEFRLLQDTKFRMPTHDNLCTCVSWLSPTCIAAGYSDGTVRVWDLDMVAANAAAEHRPSVMIHANNTYVASIVAARSASTDVLVIAGLDGRIKHISLRNGKAKTTAVKVQKNFMTIPSLAYHEFLDRILSFDDDNTIQSYTVSTISHSAKAIAKAGALITTIASSPCHPCIFVGTANGDVLAMNPLQEGLRSRQGPLQQMWFKHEWRRPTDEEMHDIVADTEQQKPGRSGLSRILEGYKAEQVPISRTTPFVLAGEKTSITAIAWNPNIRCGGWAAVGMAHGLLRIEDIAQ